MEITKGIEIIDLALYIKKENILIIADTHIGYEESLNKQGILMPRFQFKEAVLKLESILKTAKKKIKNKKLSKIIINGDIKHEFGTISEQEWRHTLKLIDFLSRYCNEIILIKGNHDTIIGPIADKRKVNLVDEYIIENEYGADKANFNCLKKGESIKTINKKNSIKKLSLKSIKNRILITHGHKIPNEIPKAIKTIIIAHEHPAVGLREGLKTEICKCFLKGAYKKKELIVMPSFNFVTEGIDILKEKRLSPFLKQDLRNFECFIAADKVYYFGRLGNLR